MTDVAAKLVFHEINGHTLAINNAFIYFGNPEHISRRVEASEILSFLLTGVFSSLFIAPECLKRQILSHLEACANWRV